MKKIILLMFIFLSFQFTNAANFNVKIAKEANVSRTYIRRNVADGEKILRKIELYFNNIRKHRSISKLNVLNQNAKEILIEFRKKEKLTKAEEKAFELLKNLFYRSYIEQQRKY